eukprot:scaffold7994_cov286-Pinguiococcus_pyrenoidosus.AAC.2
MPGSPTRVLLSGTSLSNCCRGGSTADGEAPHEGLRQHFATGLHDIVAEESILAELPKSSSVALMEGFRQCLCVANAILR